MREKILEVLGLSFSFRTYGGIVQAVRGVDFEVAQGEILGIVGESGCGKSVTAQCVLKLNPAPPGFFAGGSIRFKGQDIIPMSEKQMMQVRSKEVGFIFQDPMTSLNPTMRIGHQITEVFVGAKLAKAEAKARALETLRLVGISDAERRFEQYPHELSGGMRQRIMIAIALIANPSLIIADEPTTSLDVTIEAQIIDLIMSLRDRFGTAIMLITHDLGIIAKACDRVLVMYGGQIMESAPVDDIFYAPRHPYTRGLLQSIPRIEMARDEVLSPIEGTPPDLFAPPLGCPFTARCDDAMVICAELPPPEHVTESGHRCRCWLEHDMAKAAEGGRQG